MDGSAGIPLAAYGMATRKSFSWNADAVDRQDQSVLHRSVMLGGMREREAGMAGERSTLHGYGLARHDSTGDLLQRGEHRRSEGRTAYRMYWGRVYYQDHDYQGSVILLAMRNKV